MLNPLVTPLFFLWLATTPYQAVVVDATTSQPLAGVHVADLVQHTSLATDAAGRFTLPGPTAHFRLHQLGYAELTTTHSAQAPGVVDTLRLLPQALLLAEVRVRPTAPLVLSSVEGKGSGRHGGLVIPGSQYGVFFQVDSLEKAVLVQQITVQLRKARPTAGRIRIRLVAPTPGPRPLPSAHDLLPVAALYTAAELAVLAGQPLTVDLSAHQLRMPKMGLFVVVEGLASLPEERFIRMENLGTVVTASNPNDPASFTKTPMQAFPSLEWATSSTSVKSYIRHGDQPTWKPRTQGSGEKKADNLAISLVLATQ